MSYILDALRRSQAERERGQVPGLNAQPSAVASALPERRALPTVWVALGLLVLAVGGVAGWLLRAPAPAPGATAASAPAPRGDPTPGALPQVVSVPAPPTAVTPAVAPPAPSAGPAPMPLRPAPPATTPAPAPAPAATATPALRLPALSDLSAEQRRELPPLVLGGSIWSESALSRFVIVNGQVVREGEAAAPGVTVERIGPKAVQLHWRDLRFEVPL